MSAFIVYSASEGGINKTVIRYGEAPAEDIEDQAGSDEVAVAVPTGQMDNFYTYSQMLETPPETGGVLTANMMYDTSEMSLFFVMGSSINSAIGVRQTRDRLLADSDWTQLADAPLTATKKEQWATYRQALRDISSQPGYPDNVTWPTQP